MPSSINPRIPANRTAQSQALPLGTSGDVARQDAGRSTFEAARNAPLDLSGLPKGALSERGLGLVKDHPALNGAIAQLAQQLTPEVVTALDQRALTDAIKHAVVSGEAVLSPPAPRDSATTEPGAPALASNGVTSWPLLGDMNDGDITAISFIVLMQASKSAQEDLKAVMAGVKAINDTKARLREVLAGAQTISARSASQPVDEKLRLTEAEVSSLLTGKYPVPPGGLILKSELDALVERIKGDLDALSELGEAESLRLQPAMDRLSTMLSTLANLLKKLTDTDQGLTQNLK